MRTLAKIILGFMLAACDVEVPEARVPYFTPPAGECERQVWDLCTQLGYVSYDVRPGYLGCRGIDGLTTPMQSIAGAVEALPCVPWAQYGGT